MAEMSELPPPGWWPVDGVLRYWDGERWTEDVRPLAGSRQVVEPRDTRRPLAQIGLAITLGVLSALSWWGWFTWQSNGDTSYQTWQGIGCVLCLLAIGLLAPVAVRPWAAIVAVTVGFTLAVAIDWVPDDESGLAGVGAFMLGCGMAMGSSLVVLLADRVWHRTSSSTASAVH